MIPIPKVYHKNEINNTVPAWCTEKLAFTAILICGFPGGSDSKESACNAIDPDSVLGSRSHGGNGKPFQYFCLENCMDMGAWWATAHGVAKNQALLGRHTECLI